MNDELIAQSINQAQPDLSPRESRLKAQQIRERFEDLKKQHPPDVAMELAFQMCLSDHQPQSLPAEPERSPEVRAVNREAARLLRHQPPEN